MPSTIRVGIILLLSLALLTAHNVLANSRPVRNNDISNMDDAIKYLQDLDTYYGDRSRARFGKRSPLLQLLHQRLIDNPELVRAIENPTADEPF